MEYVTATSLGGYDGVWTPVDGEQFDELEQVSSAKRFIFSKGFLTSGMQRAQLGEGLHRRPLTEVTELVREVNDMEVNSFFCCFLSFVNKFFLRKVGDFVRS